MVLPGVSGTVEVKGTIIHLLSEDSCNLEVGNYGSLLRKEMNFKSSQSELAATNAPSLHGPGLNQVEIGLWK